VVRRHHDGRRPRWAASSTGPEGGVLLQQQRPHAVVHCSSSHLAGASCILISQRIPHPLLLSQVKASRSAFDSPLVVVLYSSSHLVGTSGILSQGNLLLLLLQFKAPKICSFLESEEQAGEAAGRCSSGRRSCSEKIMSGTTAGALATDFLGG
jgi:hypothetical protein